MSISFITALSGLRGAGAAIDAIGNNLANLNTTGFKGSSLSFQDVVADVTGSTSHQAGSGVASPLVQKRLFPPERLVSIRENFQKYGINILLFARLRRVS